MTRSRPGPLLTVAALLFVLSAIQDALKPLSPGPEGFMLFGVLTDGPVEAVVARIHAALMLALAYGVWRLRRYALWFLYLYTPYVVLNIALATMRYPVTSPIAALPNPVFAVLFTVIALGVPGGTAYLLARRREELS